MGKQLWGLEVADLRANLHQLSLALARPSIGMRRWVDASAKKRLTASLKELTKYFGTTDLAAKRALSGMIPQRSANAQSRTVHQSVCQLCGAVDRHFASQLDADDRRSLRHLLDFPAPDYLDAVGVSDNENAHSDVLAFLLSPRRSPGTAPDALERLARFLPKVELWRELIRSAVQRDHLSVRREVRTGAFWHQTDAKDRMDLVISSRDFVLVIENKLWSTEHSSQTSTYWSWLSELPGHKAAILLSPAGVRAQSEHFVSMSYLQLAWCFLGDVPSRRPEEEVMLSGYFRAVFGNVLRPHLNSILGET